MSRRKMASIALVIAIVSGGFIFVYTHFLVTVSYPETEEPQQVEISPHPFNFLNWWDITFELANRSEILTPLNNLYLIGNRFDDTDGYFEAAQYIIEYFQKLSMNVSYWGSHNSVVAYQKGYGNDSRAIVFGAHLDSDEFGVGIEQNAGGCAVVMTIAYILANYRLPIDIYYAFYSGNMQFLDTEKTVRALYGSRDVAQILDERNVSVIVAYNFDELLYRDPAQPENKRLIAEHASLETKGYHRTKYFADLLKSFLLRSGLNIMTIQESTSAQTDHAAFWERGMTAINVRSGHNLDPEIPIPDTPNSFGYNKTQALLVAKAAASVAVFLGMQGNRQPTIQKLHTTIPAGNSSSMHAVMTVTQSIRIYGKSSSNHSLRIDITDATGNKILSTPISDYNFTFTTDETTLGIVTFTLRNQGNESVTIDLYTEYEQDTDGNGIPDSEQYFWPDPIPPLDWDKDGLPDANETIYGTDIFVKDTDGDTLSDLVEVRNGLDPLRDDTQEDADGDGLINILEITLGTSPISNDTDSDLMPDNFEVRFHTNPTVPDADADPDNDTLTNLEEYLWGADPLSIDGDLDGLNDTQEISLGLDPLNPDTDDDGIDDFLEVQNSLDPNVPDSDWDFLLDGSDPNPRISLILVVLLLTALPVGVGSLILWRKIR